MYASVSGVRMFLEVRGQCRMSSSIALHLFGGLSLTECGVHSLAGLATPQPPCPVIFMGSDDPKSDLHAYVANILPTELSCLSGYWPQILDPPALAS